MKQRNPFPPQSDSYDSTDNHLRYLVQSGERVIRPRLDVSLGVRLHEDLVNSDDVVDDVLWTLLELIG